MRTLKLLVVLLLLGVAGLAGFAYFGDLTPQQADVVMPLPLAPASGATHGN